MRNLLFFLFFVPLSGCGFVSQESFYEGLRTTQKVKTERGIETSTELPSYDQYKQERETLSK